MFKISKLTDYSLRIIAFLAVNRELQSAAAVATGASISEPTVRKILKRLNETTFISSVQGASGGYQLDTDLAEISLFNLISAMEGEVRSLVVVSMIVVVLMQLTVVFKRLGVM